MTTRLRTVPPLVVLALLTGAVPVVAQGFPVGVVNVERAIIEYKKTREITQSLEKRIAEHRRALAQRTQALDAKIESLDLKERELDPDADKNAALVERAKLRKDIELEKVEIELEKKNALVQLEKDLVEHTKKVYADIRREVAQMASERNLKLVLLSQNPEIRGNTKGQVDSEILIHAILWNDPALDLTSELIQRLNKN